MSLLTNFVDWMLRKNSEAVGEVPDCFKSNPSYQAQAENCCDECLWSRLCLNGSSWPWRESVDEGRE